jgi:hypothetical protein
VSGYFEQHLLVLTIKQLHGVARETALVKVLEDFMAASVILLLPDQVRGVPGKSF